MPQSQGRKNGSTDLYVFGCGQNYTGCLKDYSDLGGHMNMPPLKAFGVWWSRHWCVFRSRINAEADVLL